MREPPRLLHLPTHHDVRGCLSVAEAGPRLRGDDGVPFPIRRVFWITRVPEGAVRGGHAHERLEQVLVCVSGGLVVDTGAQIFTLYGPADALYVPPFTRVEMRHWQPHTVLLVLCSEPYDAEDYVYD
jgi:dTDP-4-dehydrorhamnose 3,5-epimerase-like enzyme